MNAQAPGFKRMIVSMPARAPDVARVGVLADFAKLLGLEVLAAFVDDADVRGLAAHSFVRELRPFGAGWQPLDAARLGEEIERTAEAARQGLTAALAGHGVKMEFQVERGAAASVVAALAHEGDIVVVLEPRHPAERISRQFAVLSEAAFACGAATLIVPSRIARTRGPIVALAAGSHDASVRAAMSIAAMTHERVVFIDPAGHPLPLDEGEGAPAPDAAQTAALSNPEYVESFLAALDERLLVASRRGIDPRALQMIASRLGIPVLLTD